MTYAYKVIVTNETSQLEFSTSSIKEVLGFLDETSSSKQIDVICCYTGEVLYSQSKSQIRYQTDEFKLMVLGWIASLRLG